MLRLQSSSWRALRPFALRTNATLATPPPTAPATKKPVAATESEVKTEGRRRKRKYKLPTTRPAISLANPREWNPPLKKGVVPAYDLALQYVRDDSAKVQAEAQELKKYIEAEEKRYQELIKLGEAEAEAAGQLNEELEKLRETLHILEVQSEINLPDVRWRVANAMADLSKPSHRHLLEQKWRKDGDLDLLMERVHQMKVVPDVLPEIRPSIDLRVVVKADGVEQMRQYSKPVFIAEPGSFVEPSNTLEPPRLYANVFHTDTRLYTMMLVDPDVPDPENATFSTYLHWLKPNIPLSATQPAKIPDLNTHTPYIPPHPQKGTPYHRYTVLLLPQRPLEGSKYTRNTEARAQPMVPTSEHIDMPVLKDDERAHFNVRDFCKYWGLSGKRGGGVHMFREVWSEVTSAIYKDILTQPEPTFGFPPKPDRYAEIKNRKKYIS